MKYFYIFLLLSIPLLVPAQDAAAEKSKCDEKTRQIAKEISDLNDEWDKSQADLKAGLFCSKCNESKTILDKKEGFYKHLANVKGSPVPATQAQMTSAYNTYLSKYNSLRQRGESNSKSCVERYNSAVQRMNDENQRKQEREADVRRDAQQKAYDEAKAKRDREQQLLDEAKERQRQEEARLRQETLNSISQLTGTIQQSFANAGDRLKKEISNINRPTEKITATRNSNGDVSRDVPDKSKKVASIDDFDMEADNNKLWQDESSRYARDRGFTDEESETFSQMNESLKNTSLAGRIFNHLRDQVKEEIRDFSKETANNFFDRYNLPSPFKTTDDHLDDLIDDNSKGQVNRNLHFIKDFLNDISDRTTTLVDKTMDDDAASHDFDAREVFLEHMPTLFRQRQDNEVELPSMQTVMKQIRNVVTNKKVLITAAVWVFAPEIAIPAALMSYFSK